MNKNKETLEYPMAQKDSTVDDYFGTQVADPYRWLEDDHGKETQLWVDEENKLTASYLDKIPFRKAMKERLEKLWNYPRTGLPFKKGDFWYFYKNDGLQSQSVLYQMDKLDGEPTVFLNPNEFSEDGTVALGGLAFNKDGKYCAYSTSTGGSDWRDIYVIDVASKEKISDHIQWAKFTGISWLNDGFFYSRYPQPNEKEMLKVQNVNQMVYYHKIGEDQDKDVLIYKNDDFPEGMYGIGTTKDERFVYRSGESPNNNGNSLYFKTNDSETYTAIEESYDYQTSVIGNIGDTLFIQTNKDAQKYRVYALIKEQNEWKEKPIIPEHEDVLQGVQVFGHYLIAYYLHNAASQAFIYNADGSLKHQVELPGIGSLSGFSGDDESMQIFYKFSSYTNPGTAYSYDIETNTSKIYQESELDFDMNNYETQQIFYKSKDGTSIPMFIVHKKDLKLDGNNPCMLYGYGGFNISLTPGFSVDRILWLEQGGVYAVANLRGGGEFGEDWHEAGTKLNKQNVFDDFIAAAHYLIDNKYTSSEHLAISGRSNGGLLVGATMTQKPELARVAFPGVGVMDMLRYHKFTIGYYWANDYGTSDDSVQFKNLYSYSPLHNLKEGVCYPSTLVVTADHDDRVFPAHSFKFSARLQEVQSCSNPCLIRIDKNAGHGAGKPTDMVIQDKVDMWAFAFYEMGINLEYTK